MPNKVFIEDHLEHYLKSLAKGQLYIPGVIIGQVSHLLYTKLFLDFIVTVNKHFITVRRTVVY